jgi:hypothetical protein
LSGDSSQSGSKFADQKRQFHLSAIFNNTKFEQGEPMPRHLLLIALTTVFTTFASANDAAMPPKNPKAQTTQPPAANASGEYGEAKFNAKDAKAIAPTLTEGDAIIKTTVTEVCPKKGCWMKVKGAKASEDLRVTFKDYGFFVPTELIGKEVALQGRYVQHTESVEEQKHLLKDAKRPQAEIDAITAPKTTYRFVSTGVKVLPANSK